MLRDLALSHAVDRNEAMNGFRALINSMILNEGTSKVLQDDLTISQIGDLVAGLVKSPDPQVEFLVCRLLFLMTIDPEQCEKVVTQSSLAENLLALVDAKILELQDEDFQIDGNEIFGDVLSENLKLMYNITALVHDALDEKYLQNVSKTSLKLLELLKKPSFRKSLFHVINLLLNIPLEEMELKHLFVIIDAFDSSLKVPDDVTKNPITNSDNILPILALIHKITIIGNDSLFGFLQSKLLPDDEQRSKPIGEGNSLSARLIRCTNSYLTPQISELGGSILYALSDNKAATFVANIGLGYASGFLINHKIPIPPSSKITELDTNINPITGQFNKKQETPLDDMTDEDKEREAERLFVLFERLKQNGIINVENPAYQAAKMP